LAIPLILIVMTRFTRSAALAVVGAALALSACDSASPADTADLSADVLAAAAVADAVGLETAGLLDLLASDAMRGGGHGPGHGGHGPGHGPGHPPGGPGGPGPNPPAADCDVDSTYAGGITTVTVACSRSTPDSTAYGWSNRTMTFAYTGPDGPQQTPDSTTTDLAYALVSGTSLRVWPHGRNEVTASSAALTATDFDQDTVTVNGTYSREGATLFMRRDSSSVETAYALDLTLTDVRGSRRVATEEGWHRAVSGTVTGTYTATITRTAADGTVTTEEVSREISITLGRRPGHGGHGPRPVVAGTATEMRVGGRPFAFDLRSGSLLD